MRLTDYAWLYDSSNNETHPVGLKKPNAWGLYDMHGNVWEWCQDNWHDDYELAPNDGSAWEPGSGEYGYYRVFRGGSWYSPAGYCGSATRFGSDPARRNFYMGLRLVMSL